MNKHKKNMIIGLILTSGVLIVASWTTSSISPGIISEPPDFYGTSKEVSLEKMLETVENFSLSIYLPNEMPKNLELTAIYLKESPFIAIVVYSAKGNKDYITAELTIEIAPIDPKWIPTYSELQSEATESQDKTAMEINTWPVIVYENADVGGNSEKREKYGDFTLLVNLWIDEIGYLYCAPTLTINDVIPIVGSMILLNTN
jgi:hypothetical protein